MKKFLVDPSDYGIDDVDSEVDEQIELKFLIGTLEKYKEKVLIPLNKTTNQIESHLLELKKQRITQIFYLPKLDGILEESIVFLDRVFHIPNDCIDRSKLSNQRIFTLSDFGNYLFVFKLSLHFNRIQDKVERQSIL